MSVLSTLWTRLSGTPDHAEIRRAVDAKVIVITGGARGIGFQTATMLHENGAHVAIGDIDADAVGKAAADLGTDGHEVDVTDRKSFEAFLDAVEERVGPIDVLINNAGIMPAGAFIDYEPSTIARTIDVDLHSVYTGSQLAARRMVARGHGQIVNIASIAGRLPMPGLTIYNGVKAGVIEFSEALDAELSPSGVRVSTVMPTFTNTGLIAGLHTNMMVRPIEPEQVASAVVRTVVRPRTRVTAPRSMAWVNANTMFGQSMKQVTRRLTKLDSMFLDFDTAARSEYAARIGDPGRSR